MLFAHNMLKAKHKMFPNFAKFLTLLLTFEKMSRITFRISFSTFANENDMSDYTSPYVFIILLASTPFLQIVYFQH